VGLGCPVWVRPGGPLVKVGGGPPCLGLWSDFGLPGEPCGVEVLYGNPLNLLNGALELGPSYPYLV
jgi:hypothetical protein